MPIPDVAVDDDEGTGLLDALWRYRTSTVLIVVIFALLGLLVGYQQTGRYTATALVALKDPRGGVSMQGSGVSSSDLPRYTSRRADFSTTSATLRRAADRAGTDLQTIRGAVKAVPDPNTDAFRIVATADNEQAAGRYANAVATAYRELTGQSLERERDQVRAALQGERDSLRAILAGETNTTLAASAASSLSQLDVREAELAETSALFGDGVEYMDRARRVRSAGASTAIRDVAIGVLFGLVVAALAAWFRASRRPRAMRSDDVARLLHLPFLGQVPAARPVKDLRALLTKSREGYDIASTTLSSVMPDGVVLFVSPDESLARTEVAARAALAVTRDGRRVLIVDADTHQRALSRSLDIDAGPGLVDALERNMDPVGAIRTVDVGDVTVDGIAAGPRVDHVASLYRSRPALGFLGEAGRRYDLVVIDCAPFLESAAAGALAGSATGVVVVVEAGTPVSTITRTRQQLNLLGAPIVGFVFAQRGAVAGARPART